MRKSFAFLMLGIYPVVFFPDYEITIYVKIAYLAVVLLLTFVSVFLEKGKCHQVKSTSLITRMRDDWKKWSVTDRFIFVYLCLSIVSWGYGHDKWHTLLGDYGRYMGLLGILGTIACYYLASRYFEHDEKIVIGVVVAGFIIHFIGIVQDIGIDIFDMAYDFEYGSYFLTTFGSRNVYATYISIFLAMVVIFFVKSNDSYSRKLFLSYIFVSGMGLIACDCDSVYIALAGIMAILLYNGLKSTEMLGNFLLIGMSLNAGMYAQHILRGIAANPLELEGVAKALGESNVTAIFAVVFFALYLVVSRCKKQTFPDAVRKIYAFILGIIFIFAAVAFAVVNIRGQVPAVLSPIGEYLLFTDSWGGNRGAIWRICLLTYTKIRVIKKIIGYGPSSTYFAIIRRHFDEGVLMALEGGNLVDAHNEFINMLLTQGILGVITYFGAIISSGIRSYRKKESDGWLSVVCLVVVAYLLQCTVNNIHIFMTPVLFTVMGIGEKKLKEIDKK